jgi:hypothetical protein
VGRKTVSSGCVGAAGWWTGGDVVKGEIAVVGGNGRIGSMLEQQVAHLEMSALARTVQGRPSLAVDLVDVREALTAR